jgi:ribosomal-protein-alanine N-acetyltransferase
LEISTLRKYPVSPNQVNQSEEVEFHQNLIDFFSSREWVPSMIVIETPRLILRRMTWDDLEDLAQLYADPAVVQFFPSTRDREETRQRLADMLVAYDRYDFGLWATVYKADNQFIGRCGLIPQIVDEQSEIEIGYMLAKTYWRKGLATEAAIAIKQYGFQVIGCDRLISLIDPDNLASQKVALKNGMTYERDTVISGHLVRIYTVYQ